MSRNMKLQTCVLYMYIVGERKWDVRYRRGKERDRRRMGRGGRTEQVRRERVRRFRYPRTFADIGEGGYTVIMCLKS